MKKFKTNLGLLIVGLLLSTSAFSQSRNDNSTHTKNEKMQCDSTCMTSGDMLNANQSQNNSSNSQTMPGRITYCQTPTTETTTGSCPAGQTGSIFYSRSASQCSDGVTSSMQYSSWTETGRNCTVIPQVYGPSCPYYGVTVSSEAQANSITNSNPACYAICYGNPVTMCQIFN